MSKVRIQRRSAHPQAVGHPLRRVHQFRPRIGKVAHAGLRTYRQFIGGLRDLTNDPDADDEIIARGSALGYDGPDTYLVVAAGILLDEDGVGNDGLGEMERDAAADDTATDDDDGRAVGSSLLMAVLSEWRRCEIRPN